MVASSFITSVTDFDRLPFSGAIFDLDGTLLALNSAGQRMMARSVAVGQKAWELAPGVEHLWPEIVAATRTGEYRNELVVATPVGTCTVEYVVTSRTADGRAVLVAFAMDVTHLKQERKAAEATVEQERRRAASQRLESLGLVAGGVAHEFNNLLVSVVAETSSAREDESLGEATRDALARIEASARRMTLLTRQLLAYAGRGRFVTALLDPDVLVGDTRDRLARSTRVGVEIAVVTGAGVVAIEADRGLLRQVILDLVENACDAVQVTQGHVTISTVAVADRSGGSYWQLEVRDDGIGMDAETLAKVFDPFFSTKADHRGLGLSAVLGIVHRLGGEIRVESELGKGSSFRVRLPIVQGVVPPRRRTTSQQPPFETLAGMRILVADDEPTVRATVRRLLERRAGIPVLACDGAEAEALLRTERFDLVLLDVMMPGRTGYELVPIVRETQPNVPVVLMSGYSEQAHAVESPDGFVEKPFNGAMLESVLHAAMHGEGNNS